MFPELTTFTFQTTGLLLVALLLRLLADGSGRFLAYWSDACFALAVALVALNASHLAPAYLPPAWVGGLRRPALSVFCLLEYTFGFYLWAGCRLYAGGPPVTRADRWRLTVPVALAVAGPAVAPSVEHLLPFHAGLCGFYFLTALMVTVPVGPGGRLAAVGLRLTQMALAGLVVIFWRYAVIQAWPQAPARDLYALHFSPLYDGLVQTLLAFGLVILATDGVRRELEERNRRLAEVTDQLAVAARTDPLTGLLNRRAFDAMIADRAAGPFAGSVAVVDLNFLKVLNDKYGHEAGDAAIRLVARALRVHFRITDPVFRTGGDEFLALLEGGRAAELAGRLEAVDAALRGVRLPGVDGPTDVTIAWGMADFDGAAGLPDAVSRADAEMYRCKQERKAAKD